MISDLSGGFGDTVVATAAVPPLKAAFPEAELGMLLGSGTLPVIERHPDLARVHAYDHPLRPPRRWDALWQAARPAKAIIRELREAQYDVAIELFPLARNSIPLAYLAGIPTRVGYTSGGFGQLLTHPLQWVAADRHVTEYHKDLLRQVGVSEGQLLLCHETLPLRGVETVKEKLGRYGAGRRRMILCHPGAFDDARAWVPRSWAEVARQLSSQGFLVVFSGAGDEDRELIEEILALGGQGITLCDSLVWDEFVAAVFLSHAVVTVDTVAQHVASAFDRNCVVIGSGQQPGISVPAVRESSVFAPPHPVRPLLPSVALRSPGMPAGNTTR